MGHGLWVRPDRRLREADGPQARVSVGFIAEPHNGVAGKFERANTCEVLRTSPGMEDGCGSCHLFLLSIPS